MPVEFPEMGAVRLAAIVDAYGCDPARWPQDERAGAQAWLAANPDASANIAKARRLDAALAALDAPQASAALQDRLLADFSRVTRRLTARAVLGFIGDAIWPGAPAWQPLGALAAALVVGLAVAAFAPFDIPQQDDAASRVFALDSGADIDAGQGI